MKNIDDFIEEEEGVITIGRDDFNGLACVATAADGNELVIRLVRRDGETNAALLKRLDKAIGRYFDYDTKVDEVDPD